ncbi:MAG: NusG domain II-containing protein [Pelosinus sp.]|nr:NusG domain II-containing protein [Pelosinus sp.]
MLTRADKLLIAVLIFAAVCSIIPGLTSVAHEQLFAEIRVDGKLIRTVALRQGYSERIRIGTSQHYNEIEVADKKVRVVDADCPDQICVKTGWISLPSQQIVCLPWHVVIKLSATSQNIDGIAR